MIPPKVLVVASKTQSGPGAERAMSRIRRKMRMLNVGSIKPVSQDGGREWVGKIQTLEVDLSFRLKPNDEQRDVNSPTHRIIARNKAGNEIQLRVAWLKTVQTADRHGEEFLSLTFDDPSFERPLHVAAFKSDEPDRFNIVWRRARQDRRAASEAPDG